MEVFVSDTKSPLAREVALHKAAEKLEVVFLAEMLKAAKLGEVPSAFGGGAGEEHFSSFLRETQAEQMVQAGGIGLAESLYHALKERENGSK